MIAAPSPITSDPVAAWLSDNNGERTSIANFVERLGEAVRADGIDLWRVGVSLSDYHPEVIGRSYTWTYGQDVQIVNRQYEPKRSDVYMVSPIKIIHEGADGLRRRLTGPRAQLDFPVLEELKAQGFTDYAAMALKFSDGTRQFMSWATQSEAGFSASEIMRLDALTPLICMRLELEHARQVTEQVLGTYLGVNAAQRVISGNVRRSAGEAFDAVIFYCDLRGFTQMIETLSPADVFRVLSAYYDAVSGPVMARGGDVVKIIGDGLIAIFPISQSLSADRAGQEALASAREARSTLQSTRASDLPSGVTGLRAGFVLHLGQVTFGNIGSRDRLDFTVIGPAVNQAVRVENLTKILGRSILVTAEFADLRLAEPMRSLGFHPLRGVRDPKELFTPADTAA